MIAVTLTIPVRVRFIRSATCFLVTSMRALGVASASDPLFEVAVSEALTNAVLHGRGHEDLRCEVELEDQRLTLRILDGGDGFVVSEVAMPEFSADDVETIPTSGYGLPIIQTVFPLIRSVQVSGRFGVELTQQRPASG